MRLFYISARAIRYIQPALAFVLVAGCFLSAAALPASTPGDYSAHLAQLQALVRLCQSSASACDPGKVGGDEQVQLKALNTGADVNQFEARYAWLRDTLKRAQEPHAKDRDNELAAALSRLDEAVRDAQGSGGPGVSPPLLSKARARADAILGQPEFVTVENESIWDKMLARFFSWLDSLFGSVANFGRRSPWIGPALEWGIAALAITGLTLWAMRVLARQRLKVRVEVSRQIEPWEEASRNWREQAAEQAGRQEWREAIHCLYWASIVMLEGRRFWTANRSRTPREYLHLLEAGSPRWTLLRRQTLGFERIWYGLRPAGSGDYESALEVHEHLRTC